MNKLGKAELTLFLCVSTLYFKARNSNLQLQCSGKIVKKRIKRTGLKNGVIQSIIPFQKMQEARLI